MVLPTSGVKAQWIEFRRELNYLSMPSEGFAEEFDLASVDHVLSTARSVRRKLDFSRAIEPEVLFECIDIATQAPMGIGGESWRFMVVTEAEPKLQLAELYREIIIGFQQERGLEIKPAQHALMDRLHEMPAMVFVCIVGDAPSEGIGEQIGFYGSILPAAWSLMVAMRARGLGSTWTSLLAARQEEVGGILKIPTGVVQTVMLPVGYMKGAKLAKAKRKSAAELTFWNQWGNPQE